MFVFLLPPRNEVATRHGRVICSEDRRRMAALFPSWPVVDTMSVEVTTLPTMSVDEYVASAGLSLVWDEGAGSWVSPPFEADRIERGRV